MTPEYKAVGVLVTGKRGSGKTTFADHLAEELDHHVIPFVVRSTSELQKRAFCAYKNWGDPETIRFLTNWQVKDSHRDEFTAFVLQTSVEDNYRRMASVLTQDVSVNQVVIVPDVRSMYDMQHLPELFFSVQTVRVTAKPQTREQRGVQLGLYDLTSFETALDAFPVDVTVPNDGTVFDLNAYAAAVRSWAIGALAESST